MKPILLALVLAVSTVSAAQAFVVAPFPAWTLEFPEDGAFPIKPKSTGGK